MYRTAAFVVLVLAPLSTGVSQSSLDHALVHPVFRQYYACGEHAAGELKYQGDDLGTDCVISKLVEINGRSWTRAYEGTGERNEDWFGWGQDVLAPCSCEVLNVRINPEVNSPGIMGKPPASVIVFKRDDDVHIILAHVAEVAVAAGQRVQAGEKVAIVGNNGMSRSPHIHVGAWKGSQALQVRFDLTALGAIRQQKNCGTFATGPGCLRGPSRQP